VSGSLRAKPGCGCPAWQIVVVERSVLTEINEDVMLSYVTYYISYTTTGTSNTNANTIMAQWSAQHTYSLKST